MEIYCAESQSQVADDPLLKRNESKTLRVVLLTSAMMAVEITAGILTGSMALLADGWHMASHAAALGIAFTAYRLARDPALSQKFSFGAGKLIPLGGYTSAVVLTMIAILMTTESVRRLLHPVSIQFNQAIAVACAGLLVNIISALLLGREHSDEDDHKEQPDGHVHDLNHRSAFIHVIADAFTSVLAISALVLGKIFQLSWLDALVGIIGSGVILSWAYQLCRQTGWELLDGHSKRVDLLKLRTAIENQDVKILDFHVWRIAPRAVACELVVSTSDPKGGAYYRELLSREFNIQHAIIEENIPASSIN